MTAGLSPNHGPRRDGLRPELIVLHFTAMQSHEAARARLCDPGAEVSAHYLISSRGEVDLLVPEDRRAWHAGQGEWGGRGDVNSRSIGIELDNDGASPFPEPLMAALEVLLPGIMARWSIAPEGVIAHSDMAPLRKVDPGPRFDWRRLARQGLSVWREPGAPVPLDPVPLDPVRFVADARRFGYPDLPADILLAAVRLRFRPWGRGPLSGADMAVMADLARRFPVDVEDARA
ncbi:N-acetylmuramoyl-L-alanine amidase [Halodurantibacterium flavum]|uniref:N-acetylmuramoyl-L-alanine amidase n=1 Tax=Halodurantibacterium flavum TaxID=1382802 RepID=A0ABW4S8P6_9RHOB